jgi:hypothetical protein
MPPNHPGYPQGRSSGVPASGAPQDPYAPFQIPAAVSVPVTPPVTGSW